VLEYEERKQVAEKEDKDSSENNKKGKPLSFSRHSFSFLSTLLNKKYRTVARQNASAVSFIVELARWLN
jgi:hypothetical protein